MKNVSTVAAKEIRSTLVTPLAYVLMAGFMILAGFFFFTLLQQFNSFMRQSALMTDVSPSLNEWVVTPYYQTLQIVLIFLVPLLTMRTVAEEKQHGTFELLITSPLSILDIVLGKFLGVSFVLIVTLLLSFIFPVVLIVFADPEIPPVFIGFLGLVLFSLAFAAIGVAVSAFTRNQSVAGVVSLILLLMFYVIDSPSEKIGGPIGAFLKYLSPGTHSEMMLKGVMGGSDIVYFLSLIVLGLFITTRALEAQRWR